VNAAADARGLWQVLLLELLEVAPVETDPIVTAVRLSCSTRDRVHRSVDTLMLAMVCRRELSCTFTHC
jgi:hypothetical protein